MLNEFDIGNRLVLTDHEIHENLNAVQLRNGLPPSTRLDSGDFTVEMETGTGKTYVYLRTILELHKRYGFTKFIIVVPSVAIKEGVYKSLQITEDHFRALYTGTPFEYFLYDSTKLGQVRNFATSPHIQIMVVTVGAINKKDVNNLYKDSEKTGGEKPIKLIKATRPILVVDEPQSVDGGLTGRGKQALEAMSPLCTLRYSATHANKHHMVYRLDAVDAYERKLVKQIEVASATVEDAHNKPYVRLVSTSNRRSVVSAKVEIDVERAGRVRRVEKSVYDGDDLERTSGRDVYRDCRIGEIRVGRGSEFVELQTPGGEHYLRPGEAWGDVDVLAVQRQMIRRTIREHLDKEKRLRPQGIKVLSLFFIDAVERYRRYDDAGHPVKGDYARIFEDEYRRFANHPDYQALFDHADLDASVGQVHDGYFSIDRKGVWTDTEENNQSTYRVEFDNEELNAQCVRALREAPEISRTRLQWRKADIAIGKSGVDATEKTGAATVALDEAGVDLPDLLTELQDRTQLTRRSIQRILCESGRLADFKRNPQQFIELAAQAVNSCKQRAIVDGIKYQRLGDAAYYAQTLFEDEELTGYLKNLLDTAKSVYEQVVYDSGAEAAFADQLEKNDAVKVYAKLPSWFTVPTPLGSYNPDWAVLIDSDDGERLYFVVETKGSLLAADLRGVERAKITCGKAHFEALSVSEPPAQYRVARRLEDVWPHP